MNPSGPSRRRMIGLVGAASLGMVAARAASGAPAAAATAAGQGTTTGQFAAGLAAGTAADLAGLPLIVPNAGFEDANPDGTPAQWTITGSGPGNTAAVTTGQAHGGSHSLQMTHQTSTGLYVRSAQIPVTAGNTHVASAWVLGESGTSAWFYLEFWNSAGTRIGVVNVAPAFSATWQQVSLTLAAPAGTSYATVLIYGSQATTAEGVSYYDDITLTDITAVSYDPTLGQGWELFVDDFRIAAMSQVARAVRPGTKSGILLRPDEPWESDIVYLYGGAIWDDSARLYRMWYTAIDAAKAVQICYAQSRDGIRWDKPDLGIVEYQGSTANNIVIPATADAACYGVVLDPGDSDQSRRFKMLVYQTGGYCAFFSPDAVHWTAYSGNPVIGGADVANVSYDVRRGQFIATTKQPYNGVRAAFVSTSSDFITWTTPQLALAADSLDQAFAVTRGGSDSQIYGMPAFAYGNSYLALPWVFDITGAGEPGSAGDGIVQPEIAGSRDLVNWSRPVRDPLIPLGVAGTWDQGLIFTASAPIVTSDSVTMYYGGWNGTHGSLTRGASIGRVTWKRDRFVALTNGGDYEGTVTTRPITVDGSSMSVNAKLAAGGYVKVELLDPDTGASLPGYGADQAVAIRGDALASLVRWSSGASLAALDGQDVVIQFHVRHGDLYSFRIA
jgi:carbohydrate binding protein with CBM4/9 domain